MAKNGSSSQTQKESGSKPVRKPGIDVVRLATLAGVLALLVISAWNWRMIDRYQSGMQEKLAQIETRLGQVSGKVDTVVARSQPPQPRGPDPNRVYTINTVGSPTKGLLGAPVTIAEFSDFQ